MKPNNTSCIFSFLGLSLATSPFIFSLLIVKILADALNDLGKTSEELFRSERLPILNFPEMNRD
ncbi:hypothetical protein [Myxosarcina sp. GI1]|uniref:hypothetical protein n=1 Tax=Myxosarcina sp. GI1 TaxID=1541065 RepID=UPI00055D4B4A|nr:hypothetical protein [Myxosarcina sp. GI1]